MAQYHPAEGSQLNYRLIGFSTPNAPQYDNYTLEIADGYFNTETEFTKNIIERTTSTHNKTVTSVPAFGHQYTWRMTYFKAAQRTLTPFFHFSTLKSAVVDTANFRLHILKKALKYNKGYVFCDKNRVLYDMTGNAVWFLPDIPGIVQSGDEVRDLKITNLGSITFLANGMAYEITYDCDLLWVAPNDGKISGDSIERYHHEMTIENNGNYMVLGNELLPYEWHKTTPHDSILEIITGESIQKNKIYLRVACGTIIEYDSNQNVVWYWKSASVFTSKTQLGKNAKLLLDSHENAFAFDEEKKYIYVSFKNYSQIWKIKYPTGELIELYGRQNDSDTDYTHLFCHQHCCKISDNGYLYVFNNNICNPQETPTVAIFREPTTTEGKLKKIWEYHHPYKGDFTAVRIAQGSSGGSVQELPTGEIFVAMCNPYGNIFIVGRDKKLYFDAILEKKNTPDKTWSIQSSYRCSMIINKSQFDNLIWCEPIKTNAYLYKAK